MKSMAVIGVVVAALGLSPWHISASRKQPQEGSEYRADPSDNQDRKHRSGGDPQSARLARRNRLPRLRRPL
jgi:hypothetical protein